MIASPFSSAGMHQPERSAGGVDERLAIAERDLDIAETCGGSPERAVLLSPIERSATNRARSSLPVSLAPAI